MSLNHLRKILQNSKRVKKECNSNLLKEEKNINISSLLGNIKPFENHKLNAYFFKRRKEDLKVNIRRLKVRNRKRLAIKDLEAYYFEEKNMRKKLYKIQKKYTKNKRKQSKKYVRSYTLLFTRLKKYYFYLFGKREPLSETEERQLFENYNKKVIPRADKRAKRYSILKKNVYGTFVYFGAKKFIVAEFILNFENNTMNNSIRIIIFRNLEQYPLPEKKKFTIAHQKNVEMSEQELLKEEIPHFGLEHKVTSTSFIAISNGCCGYRNKKRKTRTANESNIKTVCEYVAELNPKFARVIFCSKYPRYLRRRAIIKNFTRRHMVFLTIYNTYRRAHGFLRKKKKKRI